MQQQKLYNTTLLASTPCFGQNINKRQQRIFLKIPLFQNNDLTTILENLIYLILYGSLLECICTKLQILSTQIN